MSSPIIEYPFGSFLTLPTMDLMMLSSSGVL